MIGAFLRLYISTKEERRDDSRRRTQSVRATVILKGQPLEVQPGGELQPPHLRVDGHAVDLSGARVRHVAVRQAEVGMVEYIEGLHAEANLGALGDREILHQRKVLIDETWTKQGIDRVVPEGIVPGHEEGAAQPADEPLPPVAERSLEGIYVALIRPV